MKTEIRVVIGEDVEIYNYTTKQKGYGRQGLYVDLIKKGYPFEIIAKNVYVKDVFPNVLEHYMDSYYLSQYAFYDEERDIYTRDSGNGEYSKNEIFDTVEDMLNHALDGEELYIEVEEEGN